MNRETDSFTLIELLVAITIFSVIITAVYSGFHTGILTWRKLDTATSVHQQARLALGLLFRDLNNYIPSLKIKIEGEKNRLSFLVHLDTQDAGILEGDCGLRRVTYFIEQQTREEQGLKGHQKSNVLMRKTEDLKAALAPDSIKTEPVEDKDIVLPEVESVDFRYYCLLPAATEGGEEEYKWLDSLTTEDGKDLIVCGIEISLIFAVMQDNDAELKTRGSIKFTRTVYLNPRQAKKDESGAEAESEGSPPET